MFTDLFRIVAEHELSVPPEIAGAFRALGTIEGTLTQLAPGFDVLTQARRFATDHLAEHLSPACLAATLGVMSVLMLGLHGGPSVTHRVTLYAFFGYCRLVFAGILALRVLALSSGRTQAEGPMSHGSRVDQQTASTSGNRQLDVGPGGNRASLSPATEPARLVLLRLPALDQDRFSQRRRNLL